MKGVEAGNGAGIGYIRISLADEYDADGYIKFNVDLPNVEMFKEDGKQVGFEILAIWENKAI